jgi:hypothetical protein
VITRETIERAVGERNRTDVSEAWLLLGIGLAFSILSFVIVNVLLVYALGMILLPNLPWRPIFWSVNLVALILFVADAWLHPSEEWVKARYTLVSGATVGPAWSGTRVTGLMSRPPLMTSATDPGNWAMAVRVRINALANVLLGGPRKVREGVELFAGVRARARPETQLAVLVLLNWLERQGKATEADMTTYLSRSGTRTDGFVLARDLGLLLDEPTGEGVLFRPFTAPPEPPAVLSLE